MLEQEEKNRDMKKSFKDIEKQEGNTREYNGIKFDNCGDPLTRGIVGAFGYGTRLPRDYEDFLCKINGGHPDKDIFDFEIAEKWQARGIANVVEKFLGVSVLNAAGIVGGYVGNIIPSRMIVIAHLTNSDMVVMSLKNPDRGKIYHWNSRYDSNITDLENGGGDFLTFVANSFDEFLSMLHNETEVTRNHGADSRTTDFTAGFTANRRSDIKKQERDTREYNGIKFDECGDPLTPRIIEALCCGVKLTRDYEDFLCKINGGVPDKNTIDFEIAEEWQIPGKSWTIDIIWGARIFNSAKTGNIIPSRMIVIAPLASGNLVVMSLKNPDRGKVYLFMGCYESNITDHENIGSDLLIFVANSFDEFLSMLYQDQINEDEMYAMQEALILKAFNAPSIVDVLYNKLDQLLINNLGSAIVVLQRIIAHGDFDGFRKIFNSVKPKRSKGFLRGLDDCYPELNEKTSILREDMSKW